jgi:predicted metalloendopeptidase
MTTNIPLEQFSDFCNSIYLNQKIPSDQSSLSNFTDITNSNNYKIIQLLDSIDINTDTDYNRLLKTLYNKKINFENISIDEELDTCDKIGDIINSVSDKNDLMDKICELNKFGMNMLFTYDVSDNPFDGNPYLLFLDSYSLTFSKNYYFESKYSRELNGYKSYIKDNLTYLKTNYSRQFGTLDIDGITNSVVEFENLLAPFILSNVKKRDVESRLNKYKISVISDKFKNINFDFPRFLEEYKLVDKMNIDIVFTNAITNAKNITTINVNYNSLTKDEKEKYDNGDYYWSLIDTIFKNYNTDDKLKLQIDNYIKWRIISSFMSLISNKIRIKKFNFYNKFLLGQSVEKSSKIRAIEYLALFLPELIGKLFCDTYFTNDHKLLMKELINYLLEAYKYNFSHKCKWIDQHSLVELINKLTVLKLDSQQKVGFPDEITYKDKYERLFNIIQTCNSLFDYQIAFIKWDHLLSYEKLYRTKKDNTEWEMSAINTNAYYHPLRNEIVFPAGILQKPFFTYLTKEQIDLNGIDAKEDSEYTNLFADRIKISKNELFKSLQYITMASNFGSIGAVIGHEISHGFDDNGSKFDSAGKLKTWWSVNVKKEYEKITDQIKKQFDSYSINVTIDGNKMSFDVNGSLTLGENISDLFGLRIAIDAFKKYHKSNPSNKTLKSGLMELLVSFANTWRYIESPEKTKNRISSDVHAPPSLRIYGTLQNIDEYDEIFNNIDKGEKKDIIKIFDKSVDTTFSNVIDLSNININI